MMKELIILKMGGSAISDKTQKPNLNEENIKAIGKEILKAVGEKDIIIVVGGGSYGHYYIKEMNILNDKDKNKFSKFHSIYDIKHMDEISKILEEVGLPIMSIRTSSNIVTEKNKIKTSNIDVFKNALKNGLIPVLFGDLVLDSEDKWVVISGDDLAPFLAKELNASRIIHFTDVNGVFTADPKKDKNAKLIPIITPENFEEVMKNISGSSGVDVTGGMRKKVQELMNVGIESQIVSYQPFSNISMVIKGEKIGTVIKP